MEGQPAHGWGKNRKLVSDTEESKTVVTRRVRPSATSRPHKKHGCQSRPPSWWLRKRLAVHQEPWGGHSGTRNPLDTPRVSTMRRISPPRGAESPKAKAFAAGQSGMAPMSKLNPDAASGRRCQPPMTRAQENRSVKPSATSRPHKKHGSQSRPPSWWLRKR